jgi:hypothetical protein
MALSLIRAVGCVESLPAWQRSTKTAAMLLPDNAWRNRHLPADRPGRDVVCLSMNLKTISKAAFPGVMLTLLGAALVVLATDQERDSKEKAATPGRTAAAKEGRREGTRFEGSGRFEVSGDRASFYPSEGEESFRVLENLALERVSRVLAETREPRQWQVTGTFTEYQGSNYLLVTKAMASANVAKETSRP